MSQLSGVDCATRAQEHTTQRRHVERGSSDDPTQALSGRGRRALERQQSPVGAALGVRLLRCAAEAGKVRHTSPRMSTPEFPVVSLTRPCSETCSGEFRGIPGILAHIGIPKVQNFLELLGQQPLPKQLHGNTFGTLAVPGKARNSPKCTQTRWRSARNTLEGNAPFPLAWGCFSACHCVRWKHNYATCCQLQLASQLQNIS